MCVCFMSVCVLRACHTLGHQRNQPTNRDTQRRPRTRAGVSQSRDGLQRARHEVERHLRGCLPDPKAKLVEGNRFCFFSSEDMERNSVEDMEWVKIGDSQEGDGFEDDEVPLENLSPAQLRELVLAGRKRVADLKLSMKVGGARREGFKEGLGCRPGRKGM